MVLVFGSAHFSFSPHKILGSNDKEATLCGRLFSERGQEYQTKTLGKITHA